MGAGASTSPHAASNALEQAPAYADHQGQRPSAAHPPAEQTPAAEKEATGEWNVEAWAHGVGVHRVFAEALRTAAAAAAQEKQGTEAADATLGFLRGLKEREALAKVLLTEAATSSLVDVVWGAVQTLHTAAAATDAELQGKVRPAPRPATG